MSTCISMHGEYSEHTPDADYICTRCEWLDEDTLIDQARRGREAEDAIQRALVIWREHADGSGHPHPERCVCRACWMARALDGEVTP